MGKKQKNPAGKIRLTPQQLNTRAIVTARQAVACTISMAEALAHGPSAVRMVNNGDNFVLDVGWTLSENMIVEEPEFVMRIIPKLNKDRGGITLKPLYAPFCPEWVKEKAADRMVLIQQQNAQVEKNVMEDIRKGSWC
jgi:hypothetical protein